MDFDAYVESRGRALLRLAWLLTGHRQAAEDLVQSALLDAFRHWHNVERAGSPDSYVRKVMLNRHLGGRRRKWMGEVPTDLHTELSSPPGSHMVSQAPEVGDTVARSESLRTALADLSPRIRTVLVLRYFEDRTDQEIAQLLDITPATVRSAASRGVAALRSTLVTSDWT